MALLRREAQRRLEAVHRGQAWLDQGVELVPLRSHSKALITGFGPRSRHLTTPLELREWMLKGCNLGVVLGGALGLAVADFETIQAWEEWRGTQGKDVRTYVERSGRGFHVFFRGPGLVNAAIPDTLEIKTNTVIAVAPSIHPSGAAYEPVADDPIQPVTSAELEALFPFLRDVRDARERRLAHEQRRAPESDAASREGGMVCRNDPMRRTDRVRRIDRIREIKELWSVLAEANRQGIDLQGGPVRFRARCPFHDDRSPSFWLDSSTNTWGCYASGCPVNAFGVRAQDVINLRALGAGQDVRTAIRDLVRELCLS